MDAGTTTLMIVIGLTVLGLLLVAALWRITSWKSRLTLLGLTAVPFGVYLSGLVPHAIGAYQTLESWWLGLSYSFTQTVGLSLLGVAALFLVLGRLVPYRPRKRKETPAAVPSTSSSTKPLPFARPAQDEDTAVLPRSNQGA